MKVYGYIRVSTETQAEKGGGLEMQAVAIREYCKVNGHELVKIFEDAGISGAVDDDQGDSALSKRMGLLELLTALNGTNVVVVLNTSRLWRSDTAKVLIKRELLKRKAEVISVQQPNYSIHSKDPNDVLINGIMELLDEWDRLSIALKLAKGRLTKANRGDKPAGVCPIGYKYTADKKRVEIDEDEASTVKRIFSEAQRGASCQYIADTLNDEGKHTRQGKKFSKAGIQGILRNEFYTGTMTHGGRRIIGNHAPIISKVQFGKVAAHLDRRRR